MKITNNTKNLRFELMEDGELAYLEYRYYKNDIALMHTFVPDKLRGKGIAHALAKCALEFVQKEGKKMMVYCTYVAKYLQEHPEYKTLLDESYYKK